jgi:hypothetical protein
MRNKRTASLYQESIESLKRLPRQILKAGAVLVVLIVISTILNLNKQLFTGAIAFGVVAGIAVVVHDETKKNEQK